MYSPRRSQEQWREIVEEFESAGLSREAFALKKKIKFGTFKAKLYAIRKTAKAPRFVEVSTTAAKTGNTSRSAFTIAVGNVRIEFAERPSVEYVIAIVQGLGEASS